MYRLWKLELWDCGYLTKRKIIGNIMTTPQFVMRGYVSDTVSDVNMIVINIVSDFCYTVKHIVQY